MHHEILGLNEAIYIIMMYNYSLTGGGGVLGGHGSVNTCSTFASSKTLKKKKSRKKNQN